MGKSAQKEKITRQFSAGGVVFKNTKEGKLWLLINPSGSDRWQLPKGHIDLGEHSEETAAREVFEETAVKAEPIKKIDAIQYFFVENGQRVLKTVTFFLMQYLSGGKKEADIEVKRAEFFPYEEAVDKLTFKGEKGILKKAKSLL